MAGGDYITPGEIALELGASTTAVYDWLKAGLIPYRQPRKLIFIKRKDYEDFINGDGNG